ncbi:hypothetical protein SAMN05443377_13213 [Propionibacterium cyclohexanicum]|uniref:Uncharacterized protein n=1 Tax=Propionibacterium cyclohexanicum TaxID=64702 RepID=A0A1H9TZS7_9ACTN|nr:hypothetical protein [Propionibacterium cyclohexanicum]SES02407.1 hypothetical protein SAMN05443377_13213 [Propionibacterium cyclohexanicum]
MIERATGDGHLSRRLHQIADHSSHPLTHRLIRLWRPAVMTMVAITTGAMWQRTEGGAGQAVLVTTAVVAILVLCTGRPLDAEGRAPNRAHEIMATRQPAASSAGDRMGDAHALHEIKRRPAHQIIWVSLSKTTATRH